MRVCVRELHPCAYGLLCGQLTMRDFICADWAVQEYSSNTAVSQNCTELDAAWSAMPNPYTSPCCRNSSLVLASLSLHIYYVEFGALPHIADISSLFDPHSSLVVNATQVRRDAH